MNSHNPLDPVYKAYAVASDCFRVVTRAIRNPSKELIDRTHFDAIDPATVDTAVDIAAQQAADLAVLALFATFERFVIEHLQMANRLLAAGYPQQYSAKLAQKFENEVEYWKFGEVLNLFKGEVDPDLIGQVKQVKQYRDWIAHRNPKQPPAAVSNPEMAYDVLTRTIEQIQQTHMPTAEVMQDVAPALVE
ncbi:MAG TPA: hypothetical protein VNE00_21175 [Paraburkholderia sp.]|jgi:hypothetical protein|nr:hypothetical protein [Paraburkholderia sp.]